MPPSASTTSSDRWIESVAGIKGGLSVIRGTRIGVHSFMARLEAGDTLAEIAADNPDLPFEAVEAAVRFARACPLVGCTTNLPLPQHEPASPVDREG
jgi:uncharacterized protein (DUF433 family)